MRFIFQSVLLSASRELGRPRTTPVFCYHSDYNEPLAATLDGFCFLYISCTVWTSKTTPFSPERKLIQLCPFAPPTDLPTAVLKLL